MLPLMLASDTLSITVMEILDNLILIAIPGAMEVSRGSLIFWGSVMFSLAVAFVVASGELLPHGLRQGPRRNPSAHGYHWNTTHRKSPLLYRLLARALTIDVWTSNL